MSDHDHKQGHSHGHENDRGVKALLRYLRWAPSLWRSDINDAVVALVAPTEGECVVDIGAGVGAGTIPAARAGAQVLAVEPTPFLRHVLSLRRLMSRNRKRIEVVDGAAEDLKVDSGSVDAIWAVNTMHHWVDVEVAISEIVRALAPGGRMVLVDEDFANPNHPDHDRFDGPKQRDADDGAAPHGPEHHGFTMVDAAQLGTQFEAAGLVSVEAGERTIADRPVLAVTARARTI